MKRLCVVFCLFVSSCLFSSQDSTLSSIMKSPEYKEASVQWKKRFIQLSDPNLRKSLLEDPSSVHNAAIPWNVKSHLHQASVLKKSVKLNDQIFSEWQKMELLSQAAAHENAAHSKYCLFLQEDIKGLSAQTRCMISKAQPVKLAENSSVGSLATTTQGSESLRRRSETSSLSLSLNFGRGSVTPSIVSDDVSEHASDVTSSFDSARKKIGLFLNAKTRLKRANALFVESSKSQEKKVKDHHQETLQQAQKSLAHQATQVIQAEKGIIKFQAAVRRRLAINNLPQTIQTLHYEKEKKDEAKALAQKKSDEEKDEAARKTAELVRKEQCRQNIAFKKLEMQQGRKIAEEAMQAKKVEEERLFEQGQSLHVGELLQQVQLSTRVGLSKKTKNIIKFMQKSIVQELFGPVDCTASQDIANKLYPIAMSAMKKEGLDQERFSQWIVHGIVNNSNDGFQASLAHCPTGFNGPIIFEKVVQSTFDEERFEQLKQVNIDHDLHMEDQQISNLMEIEKQLFLGVLALYYKNNVR